MTATASRTIHVAHSPDADDAFMFWAMAAGKIDTDGRRYVHELGDIESLNRRALTGERAAVQTLDVAELVHIAPAVRIDLPGGHRPEHEGVVGVGAVGDVDG